MICIANLVWFVIGTVGIGDQRALADATRTDDESVDLKHWTCRARQLVRRHFIDGLRGRPAAKNVFTEAEDGKSICLICCIDFQEKRVTRACSPSRDPACGEKQRLVDGAR